MIEDDSEEKKRDWDEKDLTGGREGGCRKEKKVRKMVEGREEGYRFLNGENGLVIVTTRSMSKQRNHASEDIARNSKTAEERAHEF